MINFPYYLCFVLSPKIYKAQNYKRSIEPSKYLDIIWKMRNFQIRSIAGQYKVDTIYFREFNHANTLKTTFFRAHPPQKLEF